MLVGSPNRTLADGKVQLLVAGLNPSDTLAGTLMEVAVASLDSTGMLFVPFHLDGTGCDTIYLTARLPSWAAWSTASAHEYRLSVASRGGPEPLAA